MATSRPSTPASPTLEGTTESASRGGLFARSNVVNPVAGVDINGVAIQDSTITLMINDLPPQSFTLNQSNDQTLEFNIETGGGGTTGGNPVVSGEISTDATTLTLTLTDGSTVVIDTTSFATDEDISILSTRIDNLSFPTTFGELNDTPADFGDAGQIVAVNTAGNGLTYIDPATAQVGIDSFSDAGNVTFTENGAQIQADATLEFGNTGSATASGNTLFVDPATGFRLVANGSIITFEAVAPAGGATVMFEGETTTSVFTPSPEETVTVTATDGTFADPEDVGVTITPPPGVPTPTLPDPVFNDDMTEATVTIPEGTTDEPGEHVVEVTTTVTNNDGEETTTTTTETIDRIIPFFQSRVPYANAGDVEASVASTAEFAGEVVAQGSSDNNRLYLAIPASVFNGVEPTAIGAFGIRPRVRTEAVSPLTLTGNGQSISYDIFVVAGIQEGQTITLTEE